MSTPNDAEARSVTRYVDGLMSGDELAAFERRLLSEPAVRLAVAGHREVRGWFARARTADAPVPLPDLADLVVQRVRRLPDLSEPAVAGQDHAAAAAVRLARRIMMAAALLLGLVVVGWLSVAKEPDPRHLEASDLQRIEQLDRAIAAAVRRDGVERPHR